MQFYERIKTLLNYMSVKSLNFTITKPWEINKTIAGQHKRQYI